MTQERISASFVVQKSVVFKRESPYNIERSKFSVVFYVCVLLLAVLATVTSLLKITFTVKFPLTPEARTFIRSI